MFFMLFCVSLQKKEPDFTFWRKFHGNDISRLPFGQPQFARKGLIKILKVISGECEEKA